MIDFKNYINYNATNDGFLVIKSASVIYEGLYQCKATNMYGTAVSGIVSVKQAGMFITNIMPGDTRS